MSKIFQMFDRIQVMTQSEADKYLQALRYCHGCQLDDNIIDMFIGNVGDIFLNPLAQKKKEKLIKDKYIRECVATGLNDLLGKVGSLAGVAVFAFYVISSWAVKPNFDEENTRGPETIQPSPTPNTDLKK